MKKTNKLYLFNDIKKCEYTIFRTVINSEWWHQREIMYNIWYLDKINWVLKIDVVMEQLEKDWFTFIN
jgi:hypothetical protein